MVQSYLGMISSLGTRFWYGEIFPKMADKMASRPNLAFIGKGSISRERLLLAENYKGSKLFRIPFYTIYEHDYMSNLCLEQNSGVQIKTRLIFCVSCTNSDFDANYMTTAVFHADSKYAIYFCEKLFHLFFSPSSKFRFG